MKKIFTHENPMILFNVRNLLQAEGIETRLVNEFAGGGVGDLPAFDTWPELWIDDESKLEAARAIVAAAIDGAEGSAWFCRNCRERNEAAFRVCWNCGREYE
jgi:hypothetical protein